MLLCATLNNNSKVARNIDTIQHCFEHADIGDLKADNPFSIVDVSEQVVIFYRDLEMKEKVNTALERWALDYSLWLWLQFTVFIQSMFYLKITCTEVLWHIFLCSSSSRLDETSLMSDISMLHLKETDIMNSKLELC